MFDAVRNNKRIVQVFLLLITVPFAMWGLDSYIKGDAGAAQVAKVGSVKITQAQFQKALRDQAERMRAQFPGVDAKLLDSPAIRKSVLDGLVDQQMLLQEANRQHLSVGDAALVQLIGGIPAFQENGKFSRQRYESALQAQGLSVAGFEAELRRDLTLQTLIGGIGESAFMSREVAGQVTALQGQVRQIQEARITWESLQGQVKVEAVDVEKFYQENLNRFTLPEQARFEYVVLTQAALDAQAKVSDQEVRASYESHKEDRYSQPEERRASHILLLTEGAADKGKIKAQADEVLAQVRKNPAQFAELARKYSKDPGSAGKGGDLGYFGKGAMVKPFEDAVFQLKDGEISGVVESDFGYHIIKLTGIKPGKVKSFDEVKGEIEADLKRQQAAKSFAEAAETFANLVYEQSDSLKPAADKYKLAVQQSSWVTRNQNPTAGLLGNPKFIQAVFVDDVLKNGRNSEAVEVARGSLVSARVLEYKPATPRALAEVKGEIEALLKRQKATELARQQGEVRLAELRQGKEAGTNWSASQSVSRMEPGKLPAEAVPAVFRVATDKLPGYTGVELAGGGYALYKVLKVEAGKVDEARTQALAQQLGAIEARAEVEAFMAALRKRYKVEINEAALAAGGEGR